MCWSSWVTEGAASERVSQPQPRFPVPKLGPENTSCSAHSWRRRVRGVPEIFLTLPKPSVMAEAVRTA